jgi:hypothetical protein
LSGFALSNVENICIFMILYDFCLLPAKFCNVIVYIWKSESHVQVAKNWKISTDAKNFVLHALQFRWMVVCCKLAGGASISHDSPNWVLCGGSI